MRAHVDCQTGITTRAALTADEQAKLAARASRFYAAAAEEARRAAVVATARPGSAILQKARDGSPLTAAEMQSVARYLVLRMLHGEGDPFQ